MVWENNTPWTHLFEKNSNFFLSKVSIWFGIDVDFCRQLVWHAVSIFFHFSNIKKRYCIHYYYIYPRIHFAPSFMRTRIVFFLFENMYQARKKTVNRIYYYFRRLFILTQYPSEWISLGMLNNFSIKIRKKDLAYQHPQCVISVNCIMGIVMVRKRSTLWIFRTHSLIIIRDCIK